MANTGGTRATEYDLVERINGIPVLSTFARALRETGMDDRFRGWEEYTVFAPSDATFNRMTEEARNDLFRDKALLASVIRYHTLPGKIMSGMLREESASPEQSLRTLQGSSLTVRARNGIMVNNARVVDPDLECTNGVIHVVDAIMMPAFQPV